MTASSALTAIDSSRCLESSASARATSSVFAALRTSFLPSASIASKPSRSENIQNLKEKGERGREGGGESVEDEALFPPFLPSFSCGFLFSFLCAHPLLLS